MFLSDVVLLEMVDLSWIFNMCVCVINVCWEDVCMFTVCLFYKITKQANLQ